MATTFAGGVTAFVTVPSGVTVSATTNAGGPTVVTFTAGTYELTTLLRQLAAELQAQRPPSSGSWNFVEPYYEAGSTGKVGLSCGGGVFSLTWIDTNLRDLLGFTGNLSGDSSYTGTNHLRGLWLPDCPLFIEGGAYRSAPRVTDLRQTESPNGLVISHVGNVKYRHKGIRWSHCPNAKIWITNEAATHESLERFLIDTQWGQGHPWFSPSSKTYIVAHDLNNVGGSTVTGWYWKGCRSMEDVVKRADTAWDGLWDVSLESITTDS